MAKRLISRLLPLFLFVSFLVSDTKAQDVYSIVTYGAVAECKHG